MTAPALLGIQPPADKRSKGIRRHPPKRNWPICAKTGKQRLGERKDAKLLLKSAYFVRANATVAGRQSSWTVCREYQCDYCEGWHLTSQPSWS